MAGSVFRVKQNWILMCCRLILRVAWGRHTTKTTAPRVVLPLPGSLIGFYFTTRHGWVGTWLLLA